ncbi:MAG TPA: transporter substrate-binding domain-containing protein [Thermoleophilaceae bacterium]|nr:transporter substrate-binding domain-containing protein [Thermoleophilaceae bacterium]
MRGAAAALVALAATVAASGCEIPQDPDGTLDRVTGGTMRVGVAEADPWVTLDGAEPSGGVEVELVRRFAREVDARVEWIDGSEEELVNAAKEGSLDLVISGMTSNSRWQQDVAFTRPYVEARIVIGARGGEAGRENFDGVRVAAERGSVEEALLENRTDALVDPVESLEGLDGPVAAFDYVLDDLGLEPSQVELQREGHVMGVPLGENAWLVRLERFLLNREREIERLLVREGRP